MTTYENFRKGGDHEDPIAPGKPEESHILDVLTATDGSRMPPKDSGEPLPKEKIAIIARWIKEGAKLDAGLDAQGRPAARAARPLEAAAAARRLQRPRHRHRPGLHAGQQEVVVGGSYELTVWDAATGKLEKRLRMRPERAMAMVFLPDGKLALAGGRPGQEGNVRIYDLAGKVRARSRTAWRHARRRQRQDRPR